MFTEWLVDWDPFGNWTSMLTLTFGTDPLYYEEQGCRALHFSRSIVKFPRAVIALRIY